MDRTWKALVAAGLALGAAAVLSCLVLAYSIRGADQAAREAAERERQEAERTRRAEALVRLAQEAANSEDVLIEQASRARSAGDLEKAEGLLKRCIEQHDSDAAKVGLAHLLATAKAYDRLFILERNLVLSSQGERRKELLAILNDVLARAHYDAGAQAFRAKSWNEAELEYYSAWLRYGKTPVGFESLRNACAAAYNRGNRVSLQEMVASYAEAADFRDKGLSDVQQMLNELRQEEMRRGR